MEAATDPGLDNRLTLREHLLARKVAPGITDVVSAIARASKAIGREVRRARLQDVLGTAGSENIHGEVQQKLDILSNRLMIECLSRCPSVAICASEEEDQAVLLRPRADGGEYTVIFDPLDGVSNIDVAISVGTIFSVMPNEGDLPGLLQPGERQLAAGYVIYGSSALMVLTTGQGVDLYVLDPELGHYVLVDVHLQIPARNKIYSINEAYSADFPAGYRAYLEQVHAEGYSSRYVGSMVADVHRTLLKGGVFLYPPTTKSPSGKLRLMYEGSPMAMIMEQAGGTATTGSGRILQITPRELHERTPVILGSPGEVDQVLKHL